MQDLNRFLAFITTKSAALNERIEGGFDYQENDDIREKRLEHWCALVAGGNKEVFENRLRILGNNLEEIQGYLNSVQPKDDFKITSWVSVIAEVVERFTHGEDADSQETTVDHNQYIDPENPIPFEDVFKPFIHYARSRLKQATGEHYEYISTRAHGQLERHLLACLSDICSLSLYLKFSVLRSLQDSQYTKIFSRGQSGKKTSIYERFVNSMLDGEWVGFFNEFPVLARLVGTAVENWVDNALEFVARFVDDQQALRKLIKSDHTPWQIAGLQPGLSDPHDSGRAVICIELDDGKRLVYKPRSVAIEGAYNRFLRFINDHNQMLKLKTLEVLDRGAYGWMEHCDPHDCENPAGVARYYQRTGMLLCVLYALEGTDIHLENLIASGEYPVIVDLEMIFSPIEKDEHSRNILLGGDGTSNYLVKNSVLRTGLLPGWGIGPDGQSFDLSAMGGTGEQLSPFEKPDFEDINSDEMTLRFVQAVFPARMNNPTMNGEEQSPQHFSDDLILGFETMYAFLQNYRDLILHKNGVLSSFIGKRVRYAVRHTMMYGRVIRKSFHPELLRDGIDRSIFLDLLSHPMISFPKEHPYWGVLENEKQAVDQMDVPLFTVNTDACDIYMGDKAIQADFFRESGMDSVKNRMCGMNPQDLEFQTQIIRGCLAARYIEDVHGGAGGHQDVVPSSDFVGRHVEVDLFEEAFKVYEKVLDTTIRLPDGGVTWFGDVYLSDAQRMDYRPLGTSLYDGTLGVALFGSALYRFTEDDIYRDFAMDALKSLLMRISDPQQCQSIPVSDGLGAGGGIGGYLYGLSMCAQFLDEDEILNHAEHLAGVLSKEMIERDDRFDFLGGVTGTILGLLTLIKVRSRTEWIEKAIHCGDHLLASRHETETGQRVWKTLNDIPLTGYSHGSAGIAYALLRLYNQTGEERFLEAAEQGLAYERALFNPQMRNWPDLREIESDGKGNFHMVGWCHGAAGIGFSRLGVLAILDDNCSSEEVRGALETTFRFGLGATDHLCCGNAGRIDFLLSGAEHLAERRYMDKAHELVSAMLNRAKYSGGYRMNPRITGKLYSPGLFTGTSGIGYMYLRLASPDLIPSLLVWK